MNGCYYEQPLGNFEAERVNDCVEDLITRKCSLFAESGWGVVKMMEQTLECPDSSVVQW